MKQIEFGTTGEKVSAIAMGCMRMNRLSVPEAAAHIERAAELGVTFFDHADIYGRGECEEIFGAALPETGIPRDKLWIQSKCGIVRGVMYDASAEHILSAVDGILGRLKVDYLDSLLLHRADMLMEPEEVAAAFDQLHTSGKVRYFGVSNHTPGQIRLLQSCVNQPIQANQLQFGLGHTSMLRSSTECNMLTDGAALRDGGVLDFCRLEKITIQSWSPFLGSQRRSVFDAEAFPELNGKLAELAQNYGVSPAAIAAAWVLRHPAKMQLLAGTMNADHLADICAGAEGNLSRPDWYALYRAAGNLQP